MRQESSISSKLQVALEFHKSGHLDQAEFIYKQVLREKPNFADVLHLLGLLSHQRGNHGIAVDLINKAVKSNPTEPIFHNSLGIALQAQGRLEESVASYRQAVLIKPNFAEAHNNMGNALKSQGRLKEAVSSYRKSLLCDPDFSGAHNGLGIALQALGRLDEAIESIQKALLIEPGYAGALNSLGAALLAQGRLDEGIESIQKALSIKPDFDDAFYHLGNALLAQGKPDQAIKKAVDALHVKETHASKSLFCQSLKHLSLVTSAAEEPEDINELVIRALKEGWIRPIELARPCLSLVMRNRTLRKLVEQASKVWPARLSESELSGEFGNLFKDRLLLCLLQSSPIPNLEFEQFLTGLRFAILKIAIKTPHAHLSDVLLGGFSALSQQCFINEYVYSLSPDELNLAQEIRNSVEEAISRETPVSPLQLVALAAYFPLYSLPEPSRLLKLKWPIELQELLKQQVEEPKQEDDLRCTIQSLTPIQDETSLAVREQYEQNPYPRWIKARQEIDRLSMDAFMHQLFPLSSIRDLGKSGELEVLIAGCGSGQQSIDMALRFPRARILAIDLSKASLSYAMRKTRELGIRNIDYAHADILQLGCLDKRFDVIESFGVLHHLAEPSQGLRVLVDLLRPDGFMGLGLYSEIARKDIVAVRSFIFQSGFGQTVEDIRQCREEMVADIAGSPWSATPSLDDFYTASECRDLFFHVQEHRFNLPQIKRLLEKNALSLIGFEAEQKTFLAYMEMFPADRAMTDLNHWHRFETEYPMTFRSMYKFWVQKES